LHGGGERKHGWGWRKVQRGETTNIKGRGPIKILNATHGRKETSPAKWGTSGKKLSHRENLPEGGDKIKSKRGGRVPQKHGDGVRGEWSDGCVGVAGWKIEDHIIQEPAFPVRRTPTHVTQEANE